MMETNLYYTFSTIPQTLAGAIALLGAFLLYRLQSIKIDIEEKAEVLFNNYSNERWKELREIYIDGRYSDFIVFIEQNETKNTKQIPKTQFDKYHKQLKILLNKRIKLLSSCKLSLLLTITLIIASIIILPLSVKINQYFVIKTIVFVTGIFWFILCIASYFKLIIKALQD